MDSIRILIDTVKGLLALGLIILGLWLFNRSRDHRAKRYYTLLSSGNDATRWVYANRHVERISKRARLMPVTSGNI